MQVFSAIRYRENSLSQQAFRRDLPGKKIRGIVNSQPATVFRASGVPSRPIENLDLKPTWFRKTIHEARVLVKNYSIPCVGTASLGMTVFLATTSWGQSLVAGFVGLCASLTLSASINARISIRKNEGIGHHQFTTYVYRVLLLPPTCAGGFCLLTRWTTDSWVFGVAMGCVGLFAGILPHSYYFRKSDFENLSHRYYFQARKKFSLLPLRNIFGIFTGIALWTSSIFYILPKLKDLSDSSDDGMMSKALYSIASLASVMGGLILSRWGVTDRFRIKRYEINHQEFLIFRYALRAKVLYPDDVRKIMYEFIRIIWLGAAEPKEAIALVSKYSSQAAISREEVAQLIRILSDPVLTNSEFLRIASEHTAARHGQTSHTPARDGDLATSKLTDRDWDLLGRLLEVPV